MLRSLRVTVVTTTESAATTAGAGLALARWRAALIARGHRLELITCPESLPLGPLLPAAAAAAAAARLGAACRAFTGELVRRWTAERPDFVHVELAGNVGLAALDAAAVVGLPTTTMFHHLHLYAVPGTESRVMGLLARFHGRCGATVAEQPSSANLLTALGVSGVRIIGRGVDAEVFHPRWRDAALRASWGAGDGDPVLLSVGRLIPTKDPPGFAAACNRARERNPRVRAVVVGDGPEAPALRRELPWATFTGVLHGEALVQAYASADIFVVASPAEPFGNVVLEAAASGLAIAARPGGAVNEVLAPAEACVLPLPLDRDSLAAAVADLTADAGRRQALAGRARAAAESCTWDAVAVAWETLWLGLLAGRG